MADYNVELSFECNILPVPDTGRFILFDLKQTNKLGNLSKTQDLCPLHEIEFGAEYYNLPESEAHCLFEIECGLYRTLYRSADIRITTDFVRWYAPQIYSKFMDATSELADDVGFSLRAILQVVVEETTSMGNDISDSVRLEFSTRHHDLVELIKLTDHDDEHIPVVYADSGDEMDYDYNGNIIDHGYDYGAETMDYVPQTTHGVAGSVIESLTRNGKVEGRTVKGEKCIVCLEDFVDLSDDVLKTSCLHLFHNSCISEWLQTNDTCPICRKLID